MARKKTNSELKNDSFFNKSDLMRAQIRDEVAEEFQRLNEAVKSYTNNNGYIHLLQMSDDEAEAIFDQKKHDESYYVFFRYVIKDTKGVEHWYRNRFACVTYSESLPVWIIDLKDDVIKIEKFTNKATFHDFVKKIVNKDSFMRSMRRAMNGIINTEDIF